MAKVSEKFIIRKDGDWLRSSRPDMVNVPLANLFSPYIYDAKEYDSRKRAKKKAMEIGGEVWVFVRATGLRELSWKKPPEGAKCGNCRMYAAYDGECKNPKSEYHRTAVSIGDECDEWEGKEVGREGQENPGSDAGSGEVAEPGRGSGGKGLL